MKVTRLHHLKFAASSFVLASALTVPATAQDKKTEDTQLEEIVVTALGRETSLQKAPAAVTAFTSRTIEQAGIERPADFIGLTSNINLIETQNAGNAFISIRGITQNRNSEPSVAVVIDGVIMTTPAAFNQELFDIQQIEVLKGPQGALYGRNAIGGAIVINTKKPGNELEGKIMAGYESGPGFKVRGSVGGPVGDSETLKFRVSASYFDSEGHIYNPYLEEDADPYKDFSVRGRLLWDASENLSVDLRASASLLRTQAFYYNINYNGDVNDTSLPVRVNNAGQNDRDLYNLSMQIKYTTSMGEIRSTTSYDSLDEILTGDAFDFLPIEESLFYYLFGVDFNQSQYLNVKAFSQDLRFVSNQDGPLRWMAGAYFIDTKRFISTGNMVDLGMGVYPVYRTPSTNPNNPQATFLSDEQNNFAWALYGDATYDISDALELNASFRYDEDKRKNTTLTPAPYINDINLPGFPVSNTGDEREVKFTQFQPKVTVRYTVNDNVNIYAGYSTGFRSGGFNQTGVGAISAANGIVGVGDVFDAEVARTFEVGFKSTLWDNRLTLNGNVFTTQSENSYFFVYLAQNSTQNLGNVPEGKLQGFELDGNIMLADGLTLNFGYGYTDSEIKDFADPTRIGNKLPQVAKYTMNLGLQHTVDINDDMSVVSRIDYQRIGNTWWDVENSTMRDPVDLVDARVTVSMMDDWSVTAWARNLFDKQYNAEYSPGGFVFKAKPRRWGIDISKRF